MVTKPRVSQRRAVGVEGIFGEFVPFSCSLNAIQSLLRRSFIEKEGEQFFLQPVVLEYVTDQLVHYASREIETQTPERLRMHSLVKAQAKDYIRQMQERLIVEPLAEQLLIKFGNSREIERQLKAMLEQQQQQATLLALGAVEN